MKNFKRILALAGAILLICIYAATPIFALMDSPAASGLFRAAVAATILIPVLLYAIIMTARLLEGRGTDSCPPDEEKSRDDCSDE